MADDSLRVNLEAIDKSFTKVINAAARALGGLQKKAGTAAAKTDYSFKKISKDARVMSRKVVSATRRMSRGLTSLTALVVGGGLIMGFKKMVDMASQFERSMAEVGTLLDGPAKDQLTRYKTALIAMSKTSSKSLQDLTNALYQTISAGITEEAKSLKVLDLAQRAAVAGLTDTATAVDAITTMVNSYGLSMEGAEKATDLLFKTVKLGKLRFDGLAHNIGKVATLASQAGVSMEELFAATTTLTKAGLGVEIATTSLKQFFANIIKPSQEAKGVFKALGIEFGQGALSGGAFTKTLAKLRKATAGNVDTLTQLIPNIRALLAGMVLTGDQAETYTEDLKEMAEAHGALEEAFGKMAETASEKMAIQWQKIRETFREFGEKILPTVLTWLEAFATWVEQDSQKIVDAFKSIGESIASVFEFLARPPALLQAILDIDESNRAAQRYVDLLKEIKRTSASMDLARGLNVSDVSHITGKKGAIGAGDVAGLVKKLGSGDATEIALEHMAALRKQAYIMAEVDDAVVQEQADFLVTMARDVESALDEILRKSADAQNEAYLKRLDRSRKAAAAEAAERKKAAKAAADADKKEYANAVKYLDKQLKKRGSAFDQIDQEYRDMYAIVGHVTEEAAKLWEVYQDKVTAVANKIVKAQERAAKKVARAWASFHKQEDAYWKKRIESGEYTTPEERRAFASADGTDTDDNSKDAQRRRTLSNVGGQAQQAGGPVVGGAVQGAQTGGGIGALIGGLLALGFSEEADPKKIKAERAALDADFAEKLAEATKRGDQDSIEKLQTWYAGEKADISKRADLFASGFQSKMDKVGRFTGNLLRNLGTFIKIALGELPGQILEGLGEIDLADLIINGVFEGIKRFFSKGGKALGKFFSGGKKGFGKSGFLTFATAGINRLFHGGGKIGDVSGMESGIRAIMTALPRAHSGMRIGLKDDERMIVGQTGERVLNRQETSEYEGGGGVTIQIGGDGSVVMAKDAELLIQEIAAAAASSRHGNAFSSALNKNAGRVPGRNIRRR